LVKLTAANKSFPNWRPQNHANPHIPPYRTFSHAALNSYAKVSNLTGGQATT